MPAAHPGFYKIGDLATTAIPTPPHAAYLTTIHWRDGHRMGFADPARRVSHALARVRVLPILRLVKVRRLKKTTRLAQALCPIEKRPRIFHAGL